MRTIYTYFSLAFLLLLMGCNREENAPHAANDEMLFRVNTPEVTLVKSEITDATIATEDVVVKVFESIVQDKSLYDGKNLTPHLAGVWKPDVSPALTWNDYPSENLSFYAYSFSPKNAEGNGLTIKSKGAEIVISQPDSYNPSSNIDYLMSKAVRVPNDITRGRVVPLNLEHAMSKVELYVYCADAMVSNATQTIVIDIQELYIRKIHTDVTMVYAPQSEIDKWTRKDYGAADATYSRNDFVVQRRDDVDLSKNLALGFIAVPVDNPDMESQLFIRYTVDVNSAGPVEFSATFNLADYTPSGWRSNHKVKYELEIDTGISLTGKITDWVEVDYVEGVVLPEINDD